MAVANRQIGWSNESNLLWNISNDLDKVYKIMCSRGGSNPLNVALPATSLDAFGRQRVSEPYTLFDSSHRYSDNGLWATFTATGGTATFNSNQGLMDLNVTASSASSVIRETFKVFSYQPGKSLLVLNTFVMNPPKESLMQRVGYFGNINGFYFELDGFTLNFVKRSSVTGALINTPISQANWNGDKLDGTGPSGLVLDITKAQILWMDFEWLGVGSVRMGFIINGQYIVCHTFDHANIITSTYITTASLPLRYEITNLSNTSGASTLKQICSSVISEGGYELRGLQNTISTPILTPRTFAVAGTFYPIISLRLKATTLDAVVILSGISILGTGNSKNYAWRIVQGGTTSGGTWTSTGAASPVEYNLTGTSVTGGRVLMTGFVNSSNQSSPASNILKEALFTSQLERNSFTSTALELIIEVAVSTTSGGESVYLSTDWQEISR